MEKKKTILLVDDAPPPSSTLFSTLRLLPGCDEILLVPDALSALKILTRHLVDSVFVKYNLSGLTGLCFLSLVKSRKRSRELPVFLFDEKISEGENKLAQRLNAAGCIEAGGDREALTRALKSILDPELLPSYVFFTQSNSSPLKKIWLRNPENIGEEMITGAFF
jgi:CheY-like chemotaxis protein